MLIEKKIKQEIQQVFKTQRLISDSDGSEDLLDIAGVVARDIIIEKYNNVTGVCIDDYEDEVIEMSDELYSSVKNFLDENYNVYSFQKNANFDGSYGEYHLYYYNENVEFDSVKKFDDYFDLCIYELANDTDVYS